MIRDPLGRVFFLVICLLLPVQGAGQELVLGAGTSRFEGDGTLAISADYHFAPWRESGRLRLAFGGGIVADDSDSLWIGAGLTATLAFHERWFGEFSFFPGYYNAGSSTTELGSDVEFRTLAAIGYRVSDRVALSIALDHRSNAGIDRDNPGVNSVMLRLHSRF
jgi:lipid A 3-O-deacylase